MNYRINRNAKSKKNSLFKNINIEEILYNTNKQQEEDTTKIRNYRTSFSHKNSMRIPEHYNEQKKHLNVIFDLENVGAKKFEDENNINHKFIPHCNFNFFLDLNLMSYTPITFLFL